MVQVVGTKAPPPWVASGGRDPDNARFGLTERTIIGVNNVYFDIVESLKNRFWMENNAVDVINAAIAENYRVHGVQPLRGERYLPSTWMTEFTQAQIVVVPSRPHRDGNPMFDRMHTPANRGPVRGNWSVESGLLAANLRLVGDHFDVSRDQAVLLVHREAGGLCGSVAAMLAVMAEWDTDRNSMMRTVRAVLTRTEGDLALSLAVMPQLTRFLPHEAYPLPPQRLIDLIPQERAQRAMIDVDMGPYLPALVRLAKYDETVIATNAKKGM